MASKDAPKAYSDRVEVTGGEGAPIVPEKERDDLELARFMAFILEKAAKQQEADISQDLNPRLGSDGSSA